MVQRFSAARTLASKQFFLAIFLLLFIFASRPATAEKAGPNSAPCALTDAESSGLNGDTSVDIRAMSDYEKTIDRLLKAHKFRQLDCLADSARLHKETFPGGFWKLHVLYIGLQKPPLHPTQQDWKQHLNLIEQWVTARPPSITARVALAESYAEYGWDARGHGESDSVSGSGWKLFEQRTAHARQILQQASTLSAKCPEWYLAMQMVALAEGWNADKRQALFEQAVLFEPGYFYYYRNYATSILPKWYGEQGQVEEFLKAAADRIGSDAGDILYFQVGAYLVCCQNEGELKLSWLRVQKGFRALEKRSGPSTQNWNQLARLATVYQDPLVANRMFAKIGTQWDEETWHTEKYFQSIKDWAKQGVLVAGQQSDREDAAEANLQTPEGQQYQAIFEEKLKPAVAGCVKTFGQDPAKFEILFKIDKDGTSKEVLTSGFSRMGFCVLKNAGEKRASGPAAFPPPPKPDYWVRYDLNLEGSGSAALK